MEDHLLVKTPHRIDAQGTDRSDLATMQTPVVASVLSKALIANDDKQAAGRESTVPAPDPEQQRPLYELIDSEASLRVHVSGRAWWELADILAEAITTVTQLCATQALPIAEIKALWLALLRVFNIVLELEAEWKTAESV